MAKTNQSLKIIKDNRGFQALTMGPIQILKQSSQIGDYADSYDKPGSSFLWFGDPIPDWIELDREEVREVINILETWLDTGKLKYGGSMETEIIKNKELTDEERKEGISIAETEVDYSQLGKDTLRGMCLEYEKKIVTIKKEQEEATEFYQEKIDQLEQKIASHVLLTKYEHEAMKDAVYEAEQKYTELKLEMNKRLFALVNIMELQVKLTKEVTKELK